MLSFMSNLKIHSCFKMENHESIQRNHSLHLPDCYNPKEKQPFLAYQLEKSFHVSTFNCLLFPTFIHQEKSSISDLLPSRVKESSIPDPCKELKDGTLMGYLSCVVVHSCNCCPSMLSSERMSVSNRFNN